MSMQFAIETRGLSKQFGDVHALSALDLAVPAGCIYGLLGRNRAGKATTIKTLMGMVRATSGAARGLGARVGNGREDAAVRRRIGHVGEDRGAWPDLTVAQILAISRPVFPAWRHDLERRYLAVFGIPERGTVGSFSKGTRAALAFVLALSRGPDLLLLDEPAEGHERAPSAGARCGCRRESRSHGRHLVASARRGRPDHRSRRDHRSRPSRLRRDPRRSQGQLPAGRGRVRRSPAGRPSAGLGRAPGARGGPHDLDALNGRVDEVVGHARQQQAREVEVMPVTLKDIFLDVAGDEVQR